MPHDRDKIREIRAGEWWSVQWGAARRRGYVVSFITAHVLEIAFNETETVEVERRRLIAKVTGAKLEHHKGREATEAAHADRVRPVLIA